MRKAETMCVCLRNVTFYPSVLKITQPLTEVFQWTSKWFWVCFGERVLLSGITKNSALWDQLDLSCLEQEKCWLWPTKYHPYRQAGNENMLGGCFSAKRAGRLHRTERPMDGTMYPKIMRISFPAARRLKVDHRWVFRQWPITPQKYRQYNTTKEQLANPQTSTLLKKKYLWRELKLRVAEQPRNLKHSCKEEWVIIPPETYANVVPNYRKHLMHKCTCQKGFLHQVQSHVLLEDQMFISCKYNFYVMCCCFFILCLSIKLKLP